MTGPNGTQKYPFGGLQGIQGTAIVQLLHGPENPYGPHGREHCIDPLHVPHDILIIYFVWIDWLNIKFLKKIVNTIS